LQKLRAHLARRIPARERGARSACALDTRDKLAHAISEVLWVLLIFDCVCSVSIRDCVACSCCCQAAFRQCHVRGGLVVVVDLVSDCAVSPTSAAVHYTLGHQLTHCTTAKRAVIGSNTATQPSLQLLNTASTPSPRTADLNRLEYSVSVGIRPKQQILEQQISATTRSVAESSTS
jgi:hypothetical protein